MTATRLDSALPLDEACPASVDAGRWYFGAVQDEPVTPTDSAEVLTLESSKDATSSCDVTADVQRDSQGFDLCLVRDPDQTCTADQLLRRTSP